MDVGFIGLGNMGAAMAPNLLNAGHRLTVYNRTRAKAEVLAAQGVQVAERRGLGLAGNFWHFGALAAGFGRRSLLAIFQFPFRRRGDWFAC
jgi:hypothetical protein